MMYPTGTNRQSINQGPSKKRKLRRPRAAQACNFCRRRKVRCSGTYPCEYCTREGAKCEYDSEVPSGLLQVHTSQRSGKEAPSVAQAIRQEDYVGSSGAASLLFQGAHSGTTSRAARRNSVDPLQPFVEGQHMAPTSGVSFLYHSWQPGFTADENEPSSAPLTSHGDLQQPRPRETSTPSLPTPEKVGALLDGYFWFATPTYRFLHRPTLEEWASDLLSGKRIAVPKAACFWVACAQSMLYTKNGDRYASGGDEDLITSRAYYETAKALLDHEPGPATLASVQARLAMCLYLLGTFRVNESRFAFTFANEVLTSLGLHRKESASHKLSLVESESRKRTFWCAYILDGYLSVLLGRPRLIRDEDVDQKFPRNFDDQDLLSSESSDDLPLHGNLEAFIWHAELAKLMGHNNDSLYPLQSLSEDQILTRTNEMVDALTDWCESLPSFLKPKDKTLYGQRTFERQNTVLKFAYAHVQILATRRCLLTDFTKFGQVTLSTRKDSRAVKPVQECVNGANTIIGACYELIQRGSLYQAFWFTQYISLVAISTLYVFLIQGARNALPAPVETFCSGGDAFDKARQCQLYLASIAPKGSQARRHHRLLDQLKARVEKDFLKAKRLENPQRPPEVLQLSTQTPSLPPSPTTESSAARSQSNGVQPNGFSVNASQHSSSLAEEIPEADSRNFGHALEAPATWSHSDASSALKENELFKPSIFRVRPDVGVSDDSAFLALHTPSSEDVTFQNMLNWGWQSFDTIGFPAQGEPFGFEM